MVLNLGLIEPFNELDRQSGMTSTARTEIEAALEPLLPRLWRFALSLTNVADQAEDLVQATCLRMLERADQYAPGTKVDKWAFTVMINLWRSERRRKHPVPLDDDFACYLPDENTETPEDAAHHNQMLAAIDALPTAQRSVVTLVLGEGYAYREVAEILDVPIGTVMSRLSIARRRLREVLVK